MARRRKKTDSYTNYKTSQEWWIKSNVGKSAQIQCDDCGKWISKYWKLTFMQTDETRICGLCDNKRDRRRR